MEQKVKKYRGQMANKHMKMFNTPNHQRNTN